MSTNIICYHFLIFCLGFDLATESGYASMMEEFERIVGMKYLKAVHLNDSKGKFEREILQIGAVVCVVKWFIFSLVTKVQEFHSFLPSFHIYILQPQMIEDRSIVYSGGSVLAERGVPCATKKSHKRVYFSDQARNAHNMNRVSK